MNTCGHELQIQDYLDHALGEREAMEFRAHLAHCPGCAAEMAMYSRVFESLDGARLFDPRPALTERILDQVAPSRVRRRRWVRAVGWGYVGGMLGSLAALGVWIAQPGTLHAIALISATASHRLVQLLVFLVNALSFAALAVVGGWNILHGTVSWLVTFGRAFLEVLGHPSVALALWPATGACLGVLWWMRARGRARGGRHVGVLGF